MGTLHLHSMFALVAVFTLVGSSCSSEPDPADLVACEGLNLSDLTCETVNNTPRACDPSYRDCLAAFREECEVGAGIVLCP